MAVLAMKVTPDTVSLVPAADCTLFLAVWHHIVRRQGQDAADRVLRQLWSGTSRILFFETGEIDEMPPYYQLPQMLPTAEEWIGEHLARLCPGGEVRHLGLHQSSSAYARNLFAVIRTTDAPGEPNGGTP
jgi:hypothetical protein